MSSSPLLKTMVLGAQRGAHHGKHVTAMHHQPRLAEPLGKIIIATNPQDLARIPDAAESTFMHDADIEHAIDKAEFRHDMEDVGAEPDTGADPGQPGGPARRSRHHVRPAEAATRMSHATQAGSNDRDFRFVGHDGRPHVVACTWWRGLSHRFRYLHERPRWRSSAPRRSPRARTTPPAGRSHRAIARS